MFARVLKVGFILMAYCVVSSALLAIVQGKTNSRIDEVNRQKKLQGMKYVLPSAYRFIERKTERGFSYYEGVLKEDSTKVLGYVVEAVGRGYSSDIVTLVGVDTTFTVVKIRILSQSETPGLGTKAVESKGASEPPFQAQFSGKSVDDLRVDKDGGKIASLTGATITSRAVTNSVRNAIETLQQSLGQKK